jgi:hypothetical protein
METIVHQETNVFVVSLCSTILIVHHLVISRSYSPAIDIEQRILCFVVVIIRTCSALYQMKSCLCAQIPPDVPLSSVPMSQKST